MKNYRKFRIAMEIARLLLALILTASFLYFIYLVYPSIPIYD